MSDKKRAPRVAGIHLSGPNAQKTALVILSSATPSGPWRLESIYERIGAHKNRLFSDERLRDILSIEGEFQQVLVDCPLSVPPCVACSRPQCPGVVSCDDLGVAYMMALAEKQREQEPKRRRFFNPQTQRLWDVLRVGQGEQVFLEPSYSSNMSPLVVRAKTLQRRLNALDRPIVLKETSVPFALRRFAQLLGMDASLAQQYRSFDIGLDVRQDFVDTLSRRRWLDVPRFDDEAYDKITGSVETFQAFVTAMVAQMVEAGSYAKAPEPYVAGEGWVYLPTSPSL